MDWNKETLNTYNRSASQLADYFQGIGPRVTDIERALTLSDADVDPHVVEIGCGDGRDAVEIVRRVGGYEGIDPSTGLLEIARQKLPDAKFTEADALSFDYPRDLSVIFAFASLLHTPKELMPGVFKKAQQALKSGGIFYISLKERAAYVEEIKRDEYGQRMFYFYHVDLIKALAGESFRSVYESHQTIGKTDWFTLALQKC